MGLESPTWISDLVASWPTGSETKSQGDDHLRAIKSALKTTFPNADRIHYFPTFEGISGAATLDISDQHKIIGISTAGVDIQINLPALSAAEGGWYVDIMKVTGDAFGARVFPASGTIQSKSGSTNSIKVGIYSEPARFIWTGANWFCAKTGPAIGSVEMHDGAALPGGYLYSSGETFNSSAYPELANVLGTNVVRDRRSRVTVGRGDMGGTPNGLLGAIISGNTLGAVGGTETHALVLAELASHNHGVSDPGHSHITTTGNIFGDITGGVGVLLQAGGIPVNYLSSAGALNLSGQLTSPNTTGITTQFTGSGSAHSNLQPSIISNMIIRAC